MAQPIPSEQQLLAALQRDDEQAFAEVYQRFAAGLVTYAAARLFRLEDARDIIQDVFVKLWKDRQTLSVHTHLSGYLYASARNRVIDHIRKNGVHEAYGVLLQSLGTGSAPDPAQQLEAKETALRVRQALEGLSPKVREVYRLSREQYLSIPEIAAQLQVSEQTVKNQLTTALNHLRKTLIIPAALICSATFWWLS